MGDGEMGETSVEKPFRDDLLVPRDLFISPRAALMKARYSISPAGGEECGSSCAATLRKVRAEWCGGGRGGRRRWGIHGGR